MDLVLKQRLVGAVVLVALAVIFIPMLLENPEHDLVPEMEPLPVPQDQGLNQPLEDIPQSGEIPATPSDSVVQTSPSDRLQDAEEPAEDSADIPLPLPQQASPPAPADAPVVAPAPATPATAAGSPAGTQQPAPATDAADAKPAGALGSWVVQVGSFSSEQNALRLRERLRQAKFVTQVEKVTVAGKTHYRVRVGPYLERGEAEQDQQKLASQFDLKGRVLSYP